MFTSLAIDPATPATLYAGTWGGGVFKSENGGANWSAVDTGLTATKVHTLAIDLVTPATLYAGTGTACSRARTEADWCAFNIGMINTDVSALAIDPATPAILYAGTDGRGVVVIGQVEPRPSPTDTATQPIHQRARPHLPRPALLRRHRRTLPLYLASTPPLHQRCGPGFTCRCSCGNSRTPAGIRHPAGVVVFGVYHLVSSVEAGVDETEGRAALLARLNTDAGARALLTSVDFGDRAAAARRLRVLADAAPEGAGLTSCRICRLRWPAQPTPTGR